MVVQWLKYRKAKFTRYPEFGIAIPSGYGIHGIDVSRYQQLIAWEEVKAMNVAEIRMGFAFIKATEGVENTDPEFGRNWRRSKLNGIVRGAYHFFISSKDGRLQAEHFIRKVESSTASKRGLPLVLSTATVLKTHAPGEAMPGSRILLKLYSKSEAVTFRTALFPNALSVWNHTSVRR